MEKIEKENLDFKIKQLHKIVVDYFNLKSISENKRKGQSLSLQRTIFYCLFFNYHKEYLNESSPKLGTRLGKFSGLHRTSFVSKLHYYNNENHLFDYRIVNGDYSVNHYYILLEKISGIDYSKKLIPKPII